MSVIKKVLIIPSWYPIGADKLMGKYHIDYAKEMNKLVKTDMLFIETMPLKKPLAFLLHKKYFVDQSNGFKTYITRILNTAHFNYDKYMNYYYKKALKTFKKYIKENGLPDIIHAEVLVPAGYIAAKIGKEYGIKVVITEHYSKAKSFFTGKYEKYALYAINNGIYTTVSKALDNDLKDNVAIKYHIPNGVDEIYFKDYKKEEHSNLNLLMISALRPGKGFKTLFEAFKILKEKYSDIKLYLVGSGYKFDEVKNMAYELGVNDNVIFKGLMSKEAIFDLFKIIDITVIASEKETFAIPGIESLATGTPLVATDCGGPSEYLDDTCGSFCKINDSKDMALKIEYVYKNINKYKSSILKKKAQEFLYSNICQNALKLYEEVMK